MVSFIRSPSQGKRWGCLCGAQFCNDASPMLSGSRSLENCRLCFSAGDLGLVAADSGSLVMPSSETFVRIHVDAYMLTLFAKVSVACAR